MRRALLVLTTLCASCSGSGLPIGAELNELVAGTYQLTDDEPLLLRTLGEKQFIVLAEDGAGLLYGESENTGVLGCAELRYSVLNDTNLVVEVSTGFEGSVQIYSYQVEETSLTLGERGETNTFTRVEEVPASAVCRTFDSPVVFGGFDLQLWSGTDLAYDGDSLWFGTGDRKLQGFDPATGMLTDQLDFMTGAAVAATIENDFWMIESSNLSRRDRDANLVESVTASELSINAFFGAAAWDGTHLWASGASFTTSVHSLLQIDVATKSLVTEPIVFDEFVLGLTWDGTQFWALISLNRVIAIDPTTFRATATYNLSDDTSSPIGIAAVGADLYIVRDRFSTENAIEIWRVTP